MWLWNKESRAFSCQPAVFRGDCCNSFCTKRLRSVEVCNKAFRQVTKAHELYIASDVGVSFWGLNSSSKPIKWESAPLVNIMFKSSTTLELSWTKQRVLRRIEYPSGWLLASIKLSKVFKRKSNTSMVSVPEAQDKSDAALVSTKLFFISGANIRSGHIARAFRSLSSAWALIPWAIVERASKSSTRKSHPSLSSWEKSKLSKKRRNVSIQSAGLTKPWS